ncbi:hypothetical protein P5673_011681 [Acropora cervicornis]|uniref:Uncharacterized protein n=1 Tax=Acropora cervicornis TaxID=6130 RepID=A0AAD9QPD8_ACRCE|nr:hypothetical protein P5673_011681 [Acropora cervicornis]
MVSMNNHLTRVCILLSAALWLVLILKESIAENTRNGDKNSERLFRDPQDNTFERKKERKAAENLCDHSISGCNFPSLKEREKRNEKKRKRMATNKEKRETQQKTCSNLLKDPAGYADEVDDYYDDQCPQIYQVDND